MKLDPTKPWMQEAVMMSELGWPFRFRTQAGAEAFAETGNIQDMVHPFIKSADGKSRVNPEWEDKQKAAFEFCVMHPGGALLSV